MVTQQVQQGLFLVLSGVAVVAALRVIFDRNVVYSALSLLVNFAVLATLYLMLNAQFIAAAQVVVYIGMIMALFLTVMRQLGIRDDPRTTTWLTNHTVFVVVAALALLTLVGTLVFEGTIGGATGTATPEQIAEVGQIQAVGALLFADYLLPFGLAVVLLLVGVGGAVVLVQWQRRTGGRPNQRE